MYRKNIAGKKEQRRDLQQLWTLLRTQERGFSHELRWFVRKARKSEDPKSIQMMFATYLLLMIKVDNKLFLGNVYWQENSSRVNRVYQLLITENYASSIVELTLGASGLYAFVNVFGNRKIVEELRAIAQWYQRKVQQHQQKYRDQPPSRKAQWNLICISNRVFARVYDMVWEGASAGETGDSYFESLGAVHEENLDDFFASLMDSRKSKLQTLLERLKPSKKNRRKKINWKAI
ncbi:MAG: hypothetical protein E7620_02830 [Ruminococcaceae bacterium]|nr:hypothetical protein [Oscillospiraceae bacterium]